MKQTKIGRWPAMSLHAAVAEWKKLWAERDQGADPAREAKEVRAAAKIDAERERADAVKAAYTVQRVCDDYHLGYVRLARAKKGAAEVDRMFRTMLGDLAVVPAANLTRAQAFDLIKSCAEARGLGCSTRIRINALRHDSRQEPYAVVPHARICAGGGEQSSSLPRPYGVPFEEYLSMAESMRTMKGKMMVSVNDHPEIRRAFEGLHMLELEITYALGTERAGRAASRELVIMNWEPDALGQLF